MNTFFVFLLVFLQFAQYLSQSPSCRTNCSTNEQCWRELIAYRSSDLIEQLFSFSSLSVYVSTFQREHPNELNDSLALIGNALQDHLARESIVANISTNLFDDTKQMLLSFCGNLTLTAIETIDQLPPLTCLLSTCASTTMNFLVLLIASTIIISLIFLICIIQSIQTHRGATFKPAISRAVSFKNSLSFHSASLNIDSTRF